MNPLDIVRRPSNNRDLIYCSHNHYYLKNTSFEAVILINIQYLQRLLAFDIYIWDSNSSCNIQIRDLQSGLYMQNFYRRLASGILRRLKFASVVKR